MTESLEVIALISGGKDSFFSLLHCIQNGHKVVALGNVHPAADTQSVDSERGFNQASESEDDEHDLNSFMYQTVGHTVVPLYQEALGIPLYRQPIVGSAIQTAMSYGRSDVEPGKTDASTMGSTGKGEPSKSEEEDETESLVPLLRRIMADHPGANALSTGAILSTYQRTRIESVAIRLGLIPFAYLWQYPTLPPGTQSSLLEDMQAVGLDARIVKVASGGLDESVLWGNVTYKQVMLRIERSMKRFGTYGDGAVLGEGGEFETLVIDGPSSLFKGRIEVQEKDTRIMREEGGSSWLQIREAKVIMKDSVEDVKPRCRIPDLLEPRFNSIFDSLPAESETTASPTPDNPKHFLLQSSNKQKAMFSLRSTRQNTTLHWTVIADGKLTNRAIADEAGILIEEIKQRLQQSSLKPTDITSTVIILRSIQDFASVNKIYGALFTKPNPPARVTIACGDLLPKDVNIIIHLKLHNPTPSSPDRKALHVQSRSYWAPANIGPYSQAISIPLPLADGQDSHVWTVSVAGQIPLIPHTMRLPDSEDSAEIPNTGGFDEKNFKLQAALSLQHLWRIGKEMNVQWWTSAVAYLPSSSPEALLEKAAIVSRAWELVHLKELKGDESEEEETRDLWEEKHYAGMEVRGARKMEKMLPDWEVVECDSRKWGTVPPFWVVEVEELPRGSAVEWHAQLGVASGRVKLYSSSSEDGWSVHQCSFGGTLQSVILLAYSEDVPALGRRLEDALQFLGVDLESGDLVHTSYLDISIKREWDAQSFGGKVPCRSIWGSTRQRLAAVLILDVF